MARLACLLAMASAASAQLNIGSIRCGQLTCQLEEYCSPETNRCAPCSVVCNTTHHNHDSGLCVKECQGTPYHLYIHLSYHLKDFFTKEGRLLTLLISIIWISETVIVKKKTLDFRHFDFFILYS